MIKKISSYFTFNLVIFLFFQLYLYCTKPKEIAAFNYAFLVLFLGGFFVLMSLIIGIRLKKINHIFYWYAVSSFIKNAIFIVLFWLNKDFVKQHILMLCFLYAVLLTIEVFHLSKIIENQSQKQKN